MSCNSKKHIKTLVMMFEFTDAENDAIHGFIPMTQELFNSCMDKCMELGPLVDDIFFDLIDTYPDFLANCPHARYENYEGSFPKDILF